MKSLKTAALNSASPEALKNPAGEIAEAVNTALEGQSTAMIIQTLTGLLAGHIVNAADGQEEGIDDLLAIAGSNLKLFSGHLATQHRLALLRQSVQ